MQSLLLKLQADIESRKRPHWDIVATAKSALLGTALAMCAFLLGIRAAEGGAGAGTLMAQLGAAPAADLVERIEDIAMAEGIDVRLAFGLVATESEFNRRAVSPVGAVGYTQLMPSTARYFRPGVEREALFDRDTNLRLGFRFLRTLIDKYHGNVELALLAYNRGPERVDAILRNGGDPDNGYPRLVLRKNWKTRH